MTKIKKRNRHNAVGFAFSSPLPIPINRNGDQMGRGSMLRNQSK